MIEILQQAIQMQPSETRQLGEPLACDPKYMGREDPPQCGFVIYSVGAGQVQLTCTVHGNRLLATEKAVGTSHEGSLQRMLATHEHKRSASDTSRKHS